MIKLSYEDIIKKINAEKNIPEEEIILKIKRKQEQLTNLVSKDGAAHIVANEYGVQVFEDVKSKIINGQSSPVLTSPSRMSPSLTRVPRTRF